MPFIQHGFIRYFSFNHLIAYDVPHAVFTRQGGVSPPPWNSLNVGAVVGDNRKRVDVNIRRAFIALDRQPNSMYDVWQNHSANVVRAIKPRSPTTAHVKADAIITDRSDVTLFMRFADCVPILLFDPVRQVVGIVHAGWKGTVLKTVRATVKDMQSYYKSKPEHILAGIGPSIGPHHYEVGSDVISQVRSTFGSMADQVLLSQNRAIHLDLWTANRILLEQSGVELIEISKICTACHPNDWYSHRGENGKTGRFGALIGLKD